jgi:hypothetical protein
MRKWLLLKYRKFFSNSMMYSLTSLVFPKREIVTMAYPSKMIVSHPTSGPTESHISKKMKLISSSKQCYKMKSSGIVQALTLLLPY